MRTVQINLCCSAECSFAEASNRALVPYVPNLTSKESPRSPLPCLLDAPAPAAGLLAFLQLGHVPGRQGRAGNDERGLGEDL